ncbi:MFS transporter [Pseudomonas kuykendallii]|uniref:Predicted arabinose efflux permease, MFS family n=1 Tax=Pseudomonas kuykendallii TaxID=1007099 RepID=A0A1H2XP40_9PSED|nr:MFS transporter [Pseudomonas kuykendallii]MCQ4272636.1 MFS transporter [Pseudomonas kuykendallii]SDW94623.1 Predicted arabinose efflux permease, MFS family [Pseudomonas kuykendallii]
MKTSLNLRAASTSPAATTPRSRSLLAACLTHALHDGYTDGLYAFLPVWQAQFGLSYAALAMVRALYYGTMGGLQIPADRVLRNWSPRATLILSTLLASAGLLLMALPLGFAGLCVGLVVAGIGSSIQHPRGSMLVTDTYGADSRRPLGIYNFSGDLGKAVLPAVVALLLPLLAWRPVLALMAVLGVALVIALLALAPNTRAARHAPAQARAGRGRSGFGILTTIGALDTATRMGYLLFLPFLIHARGGDSPTVGLALALLFLGGAFGKFTFSWLGERVGVTRCVALAETVTALLIIGTLFTPLIPTLILLPLLGIVLNGTSSVLYGTVPELSDGDTGRAFAVFYTSVIGSGGVAPILYGAIADHSSQTVGLLATAATAAAVVPLVLVLSRFIQQPSREGE